MTLGKRLRDLRQAAGLSQAALGRRCKPRVRQATISDLESGVQQNAKQQTLERLAKALGVEVADLYRGNFPLPHTDAPQKVTYAGGSCSLC